MNDSYLKRRKLGYLFWGSYVVNGKKKAMIWNISGLGFLIWMMILKIGTTMASDSAITPRRSSLGVTRVLQNALENLRDEMDPEYLAEISQILAYFDEEKGKSNVSGEIINEQVKMESESNLMEKHFGSTKGEEKSLIVVKGVARIITAGEGKFSNVTQSKQRLESRNETNKTRNETNKIRNETNKTRNETNKTRKEVNYEELGCGVKNEDPVQARILGGEEAGYGEWPWQVALVRMETGKAYCGASLLNTRFLLTAGHCASLLPPRSIQAWLGSYMLSRHRETHRVVRRISHIIIHADFIRRELTNDIALLRMSEPVQMSRYIRPVCLPDVQDWDTTLFDGSDKRMGVVTGWGLTKERGSRSLVLMQVKLPFLNVSECRKLYARINPVTNNMLCTLYNSTDGVSKDSCKGDSGGPLVTVGAEGRWTQVGVVSFGYGCGREGYPGVYTRITQYLLWIYLKIVQIEISIMG